MSPGTFSLHATEPHAFSIRGPVGCYLAGWAFHWQVSGFARGQLGDPQRECLLGADPLGCYYVPAVGRETPVVARHVGQFHLCGRDLHAVSRQRIETEKSLRLFIDLTIDTQIGWRLCALVVIDSLGF